VPKILHVDQDLIVVDKPSGLLAVPGRGPDKQDCAIHRLQQRYADALVVHRLDMATSGLMVFARGSLVQRALSIAFAERRVHKRYEALVQGRLERAVGERFSIDLPLLTDWPHRPRQKVDFEQGKPAQTLAWVQQHAPDGLSTRMALEPITGRSHQLRVHLLSIGHPICGDALYASEPSAWPRLMLHACELALPALDLGHPGDGRALSAMSFSSAAPF
jgi:tRNA pseudouridine32 synthase/23S rRNA pseudouridine746 synthase